MSLYKNRFRSSLFRIDPERAHDMAINVAAQVGDLDFCREALHKSTAVNDPRLEVQVAGLLFGNPVGLAAGYDKSGFAVDGLAALGFGHIEVGSVSADPSYGNPKPRLWRLPEDEAVIVHYGLQNAGAQVVSDRLLRRRTNVPVGVNIVKTNRGVGAPPDRPDAIIDEYVRAVKMLCLYADYLTLNLSCPNTEDGRDFFTEAEHTRDLLAALSDCAVDRPLFLKISPLGDDASLDALLDVVVPFEFVTGFLFNLAPGVHAPLRTPDRRWRTLPGALAGKPVKAQMDDRIRSLYSRMDRDRYKIIGVGGVSTAEDAYLKVKLGASLIQLLTALIYEGPWVVKRINQGLCRLMDRDGVKSMGEVVGVDVQQA